MRKRTSFPWVILGLLSVVQARAVPSDPSPQIHITGLPAYGSAEDLRGDVVGVDPSEYQVAAYLFLEGSGWWAKPTFANPCTPIDAAGSWQVDVVTGGCDAFATQYAAYLVPIGEECPLAAGDPVLPAQLGGIAVASALAHRNPYLDSPLGFSGYSWIRKDARCLAGPGPNLFSPDNAWVDGSGNLHLAITRDGSDWRCAELYLTRSLGYGEYRVHTMGRVDLLDPRMVFGLFTWDPWAPPHHREMDIELSRWSDPL